MSTWSALRMPGDLGELLRRVLVEASPRATSPAPRRACRPRWTATRAARAAPSPRRTGRSPRGAPASQYSTQLVLHRRADVAVGRHHDVAIVRGRPVGCVALCHADPPSAAHPRRGWHSVPPAERRGLRSLRDAHAAHAERPPLDDRGRRRPHQGRLRHRSQRPHPVVRPMDGPHRRPACRPSASPRRRNHPRPADGGLRAGRQHRAPAEGRPVLPRLVRGRHRQR